MLDCIWRSPLADLSLAEDEVHLWRIFLDQPKFRVDELLQTLSEDEQQRAARFYDERDRTHFIVSRGGLRTILATYLQKPPADLTFTYGAYGKPTLTDGLAQTQLRFNLSHSQGLALYAITQHRQLGIDIEWIRPTDRSTQLIQRFFSPQEATVLRSLPVADQHTAFFKYWTCKEAYIKAVGAGVFRLAKQVEIAINAESAQIVSIAGDLQAAQAWSLATFTPNLGYAGALVVAGQPCHLKYWQLWQG